jgi:NAD(P)-dependent dehydrogenase (short-subunit alcohol dehydrogenase family)
VVIADRDEESAVAAAERLGVNGDEAVALRVDATRLEDIDAMVESTLETFGRLDILINNAGINGRNAPLWEVTDEKWDALMAINLTSVFRCCRAAIGHMRERRSGAIVNVSSIGGKEGNANQIPYSVSKAGVICLTKMRDAWDARRRWRRSSISSPPTTPASSAASATT